MDKLRERIRRDLNAHAAAAQAEDAEMYEEFAERARARGDLKDAAHWEQAANRARTVPLPFPVSSES
ncbi:hypothetical protein HH310_07700 [Actinoplanes sp. TBRC 11911]|uniref:hypothetical protein n=1 Tax=Actinoplanes sp. TBRC 11911 TaxID=2729386 RepID=UPI00145F04E1|nr:hypothetical protein [Actinoplanes sp. TBRC 11911]NMO51072.1 hypothetical protein [Actinoplanes sp. TBRC 11911]